MEIGKTIVSSSKNKMKADSKQLPREEWNFSELDDKELQLAFFYEYGRASDHVKTEVAKMRASRPPGQPNFWNYPNGSHQYRLYEVIHWCAEQEPQFPEQPWLTLKANTIAEIKKERAGLHWGWSSKPGDPVESIEWMVKAVRGSNVHLRIGGAGFHHVWCGDPKAVQAWIKGNAESFSAQSGFGECVRNPASSFVEGSINWNLTDSEIIERFKWLLKSRPAQFRHCAKTPAVQRGFDNSFPFTMKSALDWLGVLRRRQSVKTWREYMELYNLAALNKQGKNTVKSRDISTLAIPREADCRKVKLILEWFDKGTPLKKEDFK